MMVIDGTNRNTYAAASFWEQTLTGLSTNTYYVFTYWATNAFTSIDGNAPIITTKINGSDAPVSALYPAYTNPYNVNSLAWTKLSYLWYSGASTSALIQLFDG